MVDDLPPVSQTAYQNYQASQAATLAPPKPAPTPTPAPLPLPPPPVVPPPAPVVDQAPPTPAAPSAWMQQAQKQVDDAFSGATASADTSTTPETVTPPSSKDDWASQASAQAADALGMPAPTPPPPPAAPSVNAPATPSAVPPPVPMSTPKPAGNLISNQFDYQTDGELTPAEAASACGPVAALAFARATGRNPTVQEALGLAKDVGWTPALGMAGGQSEVRLLGQLGVDSSYVPDSTPTPVNQELAKGKPVILDTPNHYYVIDDYNPQTGLYHVGGSGLALKGGSDWMSWQQIAGHGGGVSGSIVMGANQPHQANQQKPTNPTAQPDAIDRGIANANPQLVGLAGQAAAKAGIDPRLFARQIYQESQFDPTAGSPAGAQGIAQFMPDTARGLGIDPSQPAQALQGAATLMASYVKQYGNIRDALIAYNAGPGTLEQYLAGKIQLPQETQLYLKNILSGGPGPAPAVTTSSPSFAGASPGASASLSPADWVSQARQQASAALGQVGQDVSNVGQGIVDATGAAGPPLAASGSQPGPTVDDVASAAAAAMHELPRARQIADLGLPIEQGVPDAPTGSPGQKLMAYINRTDPNLPINARVGQALDLAQQDQDKFFANAAAIDPTGGQVTGLAQTATHLLDPTMLAGGFTRGMGIGAAIGGVGGGAYSAASGASPAGTAANIESGANLGMLGGGLAEGPISAGLSKINQLVTAARDSTPAEVGGLAATDLSTVQRSGLQQALAAQGVPSTVSREGYLIIPNLADDANWAHQVAQAADQAGVDRGQLARYGGLGASIPSTAESSGLRPDLTASAPDLSGGPAPALQASGLTGSDRDGGASGFPANGRPGPTDAAAAGVYGANGVGLSVPEQNLAWADLGLMGSAGGVRPNIPSTPPAPTLASRVTAPVTWVRQLLAPAANAPKDVQAALADLANRKLQAAVDAETWRLNIEHALGKDDHLPAASSFEKTSAFNGAMTPEQQALATRMGQFTQDTRDVGIQHGYINGDVTSGQGGPAEYFPHVYQERMKPAVIAASKSGLNPSDFYSKGRVFPTLDDAVAAGHQPLDSVSQPFSHYAGKVGDSEAKWQFIEDLKNASPSAAIPYSQGQDLPAGWVPGLTVAPQFAGVAFPQEVAAAAKNILNPSSLRSTTLGAAALDALGTGKEMLFSLSGFHMGTELRQAIRANGINGVPVVAKTVANALVPGLYSTFRRTNADTYAEAARAGVTGLAGPGLQLDQGGALRGIAAPIARAVTGGIAGAGSGYQISQAAGETPEQSKQRALIGGILGAIAGPTIGNRANAALWERMVPTLKVLTWQIQKEAGRNPEAAAQFVNNTFGGQNLAAIARSKSVQDGLLRMFTLAPDWWEGWANQLAGAVRPGDLGGMSRAYWARTAVIDGVIGLEGLNYALNGHFTNQNDADHPNELELTGLYDKMGWDRRDPKTGAKSRVYMDILGPIRSILDTVTSQGGVGSFLKGRASLTIRTGAEVLTNKDYRGQPIVPPGTSLPEGIFRQGANVVSQIAPIGAQQVSTSGTTNMPAPLSAFAGATGLRTAATSNTATTLPSLAPASRSYLASLGSKFNPGPVADQINGVGLTRDERNAYQAAVNANLDQKIADLQQSPNFQRYTATQQADQLKSANVTAHEQEGARIYATIPNDEKAARIKAAAAAKNKVAPVSILPPLPPFVPPALRGG